MRQLDNAKDTRKIAHDMDYMTAYQGDPENVQDSAAIKVIIRMFPELFNKFKSLQNHGYTIKPIERNAILLATVKAAIMDFYHARLTIERQQRALDKVLQQDLFPPPKGA